jgi:hypothetical protein
MMLLESKRVEINNTGVEATRSISSMKLIVSSVSFSKRLASRFSQELARVGGEKRWSSWKHLGITGQIIFCEICKVLCFTDLVIADVTTLNFNLLLEIG